MIPAGKLITIAGIGGAGKGMAWAALVADLSVGQETLGNDVKPPGKVGVLLVGCEDGFEDTVIPRLAAAGADLKMVHILDGVRSGDGKSTAPFSLDYLLPLDRFLEKNPSIKLIIIDPVTGYVGRAGVKDHHDAELRALLEPVAELANRRGVTIIMVKHLNKDESKTVASRVGGSVAYVNIPRACALVTNHPSDPNLRVLVFFKWNLNVERPQAITWTMEPAPRIESRRS